MNNVTTLLNRYASVLAGMLLAVFFVLSVASVWNDVQSMDEAVHLSAGYSYLTTGDYRLNPEHPALMKMLDAAPLLLLDLSFPNTHPTWVSAEQWGFGSVFLYENTVSADTMMRFARFPTIILSVLIGVWIFKWSKELFGGIGALLSVALFTFDPTTLAHSHYVTTDAAAAFGFLTTVYAYYRYLLQPSRVRFWLAALLMVIALLLKFSTVILVPILVLLWLVKRLKDRGAASHHALGSLIQFWLAVGGCFLACSWVVYGFALTVPADSPDTQFVLQQLEDIRASDDPSQSAPGSLPRYAQLLSPDTRIGSAADWIVYHVPIPAWDYYRGIISVFLHNTYGHATYLMGDHANSFWNYFIVAFFVKTPEVTLILLGLTLLVCLKQFMLTMRASVHYKRPSLWVRRFWRGLRAAIGAIPLSWWALALPVVLYFLWSLTARINLGVRHLLPIYPFLFILIGMLGSLKFRSRKIQTLFSANLLVLMVIYIGFSSAMFPHYLSYFNVFVGGPNNGHLYLLDSNIEWGQDLKRVRTWLDDHGETQPVYMQYFGTARPEYYGFEFEAPPSYVADSNPTFDQLIILSIDAILSEDQRYAWVLGHRPVARIGYSTYIYDFRN